MFIFYVISSRSDKIDSILDKLCLAYAYSTFYIERAVQQQQSVTKFFTIHPIFAHYYNENIVRKDIKMGVDLFFCFSRKMILSYAAFSLLDLFMICRDVKET